MILILPIYLKNVSNASELNPFLIVEVDLGKVTSVISNLANKPLSTSSTGTEIHVLNAATSIKIVINGYIPRNTGLNGSKHHRKTSSSASGRNEIALLTLHPPSQMLAAEWLDGLLMLLNQQPITQETKKLVQTMADWGLKIRLLNVKFEESLGTDELAYEMPTRDDLDYDYYYDVFGTA